jgi:alpha-beta hydrolase superfamily lysophospholipase
MWLLALVLVTDTIHTFPVALSGPESLTVTVSGAGDPVVLVPGLFGSAFGYRRLIPLLTDAGYRAIVVEPLAIGTSARPEHADYSLTAQADRIAAALDQLGVRHAIVIAHSLGASMAYRMAYRRPDLVRASSRSTGVRPSERPHVRFGVRWSSRRGSSCSAASTACVGRSVHN